MVLTVRKIEVAADGSVIREMLLPYLCGTKSETKDTAQREAERYPESGENNEQGYFWARDEKGQRFLFIP
jgi:hypothetical protein